MVQYRPCAREKCQGRTPVKSRLKFCNDCRAAGHTAGPVNQFTKGQETITIAPEVQIQIDRDKLRLTRENASLKESYKNALRTIEDRDDTLRALGLLKDHVEVESILPKYGQGTSEATPVLVASDWHAEEQVGAEVGGLNTFNLEIAELRAKEFFTAGHRLIKLLNQDVKITTVVLALLGDYITNQIHGAEAAEKNALQPTHAIILVMNWIIAGIEFWLAHTPYTFVIVCKSGNHGRTSLKTRFSAETGHSLEYLMFLHLKAHFRTETRVQFIIEEGIHSYLTVYDQTLRFHHGHAIKYGGGVGGITIPVNKAIAAWDQARTADVDVFGHFHQYTVHKKFICNGSLIGFNGFALSIKAQYERPQQALFLLDKKRGLTANWPILFSR